jgi:hypothetical protein
MKKLIPVLGLLVACTSKPSYTPTQEKIIKLAQHLEPDSARYVPLRFSKAKPYTRADSVQPTIDQYTQLTDSQARLMLGIANTVDFITRVGKQATAIKKLNHESYSLRLAFNQLSGVRLRLLNLATHTVVGQNISHSWRVGERIDSAHFVVFITEPSRNYPLHLLNSSISRV